jgi:E3 ubiquitin-protein ligase RFWD3
MPPPTEVHTDSDSDLGDDGVVEMEDDARSGEEGHGRAGAVAAAEGANAEGRPPACCPVCMDPWTCNGAHRIW